LLRFRLEFHAVLIDTPPMLEFSDARVLGRLSDGVIMVVRASDTSRDDAATVYRRFQEDGTAVLGSILNDWNSKKSKHGYGYRTSGAYSEK
jgi:Mrp family chromosome partitioning ATPase